MRTFPEVRFERYLERQAGGCWPWKGAILANGYGQFFDGEEVVNAHRWVYEHFVGPIPMGFHVHHKCKVRHCVNPKHLEALAPREHLQRGDTFQARNAAKTHCAHGHPFSGDNLALRDGRRRCVTCCRASWHRWHARKFAKVI